MITVISTVPELSVYRRLFLSIEVACALFFMAEYVLRLSTSPNRRAYIFSFWGFIDLMSFLPTIFILVPLPAVVFAQQLKILLAFRSLRIAKLARTYILESRSDDKREGHHEGEETRIPVSVFFFTQISASILNGAVMYAVEGSQPSYATMPKAILEVTKVLLDSDPTPPQTTFGQIFVLLIYFQRLCLLGLLIEVMGSAVRRLLFGHSK
ncbi:MAG: voltage-gated potassium channel [Verrucomicrobia bacterium]|nr:MAG: voltage-gated potassium channel [Verrucomicrobiota bacterium]